MANALPNERDAKGNVPVSYTGMSVDNKPTIAPEGSTLYCVDTGEGWVFHIDTWYPDLRLPNRIYNRSTLV